MHSRLEQQLRLSVREGHIEVDVLVRLVDTAYREDDSRFHMLIDRLSDALLVLDADNQVLMVNTAARKLLRLSAGMVNPGNLRDYVPELAVDDSLANAQGAMLAEQDNIMCRTLSGRPFKGHIKLFSLKTGEAGKRIAILERDCSQEAPGRTQTPADAEPAAPERDRFLAAMSHELRTPMNAVLGMSKHLLSTELTADQRESVKTMLDAGDVMMSLLNDLLDKSKIEAGKMTLQSVNLDVRHTVRKIERLWRPSIEKTGVNFLVKVADDVPPVVMGDPVRLRQILSNLLSNAAKFTEEGSVVLNVGKQAVAGDDGVELVFSVRDTGAGMDRKTINRMFEDYSQGHKQERVALGTGLGLSISRELARMMGGDLQAESSPGLGSVFTFKAPFDVVGDAGITPAATARSSAPASTTKADDSISLDDDENVRILAVEDNPINQRVLAAFLRPIGGEVVWAGNGKEALDQLETGRFDVVLMDIQMPVMNGLEAVRALRKSDMKNRNIPVVAMTANAMMGDRETCLEAGMDDYVSKPIDPKQLYKVIARQVEEGRTSPLDEPARDSA